MVAGTKFRQMKSLRFFPPRSFWQPPAPMRNDATDGSPIAVRHFLEYQRQLRPRFVHSTTTRHRVVASTNQWRIAANECLSDE